MSPENLSNPCSLPLNDWNEYKILVLRELERHEQNFEKLILVSQENKMKLNSIEQSIKGLTGWLESSREKQQALCERVEKIEKDAEVLKTKIMFYGAFISIFATGLVNLVFQYIKI